MGLIEETANNVPGILEVLPFAPGTANSFFDVYFQIQFSNQTFFASQAAHMQAVISHKPPAPGEGYVNPFTTPIQLLNSAGQPTGLSLIRELHRPDPPVEVDRFGYSQARIVLLDGTGAPP